MQCFKQLSLVLLDPGTCPTINILEEKLSQHSVPMMTALAKSVQGFVSAYPFSEQMVFAVKNSWKITLRKEEKLLPSYVVRDELKKQVDEIEQQEHRTLSNREKSQLKQQLIDELLSKAFIKQSDIEAVYNTTNGFLLINQANENKRDLLVTELRRALDNLNISLPKTKTSMTSLMTTWLTQGYADGRFSLEHFCELKSTANTASVIKFYNHHLLTPEIQDMVKSNRFVSQLALVWNDKVKLILGHDFTLKNIQLIDIEDYASEGPLDDVDSEILSASANQLMMVEYLSQIYHELIEHAGGLLKE